MSLIFRSFLFSVITLLPFVGFSQSDSVSKSKIAQDGSKLNLNDTIPMDPNVRYGKLENGFTYYIAKNDNPKGKIEIRFVVKAGYDHEERDQ